MPNLIDTGSSVSGNGYGYRIYRESYDTQKFLTQLSLNGHRALVSVDSYASAHEVGRAFCHACHQWQVVQNREHALSSGCAVIG